MHIYRDVQCGYSTLGSTILSRIARSMGPLWGPSGADRTQVGPMLAPWTLLSGQFGEVTECSKQIYMSGVEFLDHNAWQKIYKWFILCLALDDFSHVLQGTFTGTVAILLPEKQARAYIHLKLPSYWNLNPLYKPKMVWWPPQFYNGNHYYSNKTVSS